MDRHTIHLEMSHDHALADELNALDLECRFDDTKWPGRYELHIIKKGNENLGFCVIALNCSSPEVAKFFICPDFRKTGLAVIAAHRVFEYIEREHGATYSLQIRDKIDCQESVWRFWCNALQGRSATQSGLNFLVGNWDQ
ncbi:hypothetical protein [Pseudomonas sp. R32]|uniref:hypothetical protein n=1 Tax=Pseudomonas sp. R32 TaxID=1573704 RepID=UPI00132E7C0D|nr:hypothetical protein [Pseudomonas sp. R32]QHF28589.1 hypothetical protein PspR32_12555 [Pseudomonas sp. R32]